MVRTEEQHPNDTLHSRGGSLDVSSVEEHVRSSHTCGRLPSFLHLGVLGRPLAVSLWLFRCPEVTEKGRRLGQQQCTATRRVAKTGVRSSHKEWTAPSIFRVTFENLTGVLEVSFFWDSCGPWIFVEGGRLLEGQLRCDFWS